MRKRAFTLIELLVVIAIIAILAAILFPVFTQAKAAAKKTTDISNFKQFGTGMAIYMSNFDDYFPMSNSGGSCSAVFGWGFGPPDAVPGQVLNPYLKNTQIMVCPMDSFGEEERIRDHQPYLPSGNYMATMTKDERLYALGVRSNIGYNYAFFSPWRLIPPAQSPTGQWFCGSAAVNGSEVDSPSGTIAFFNSIWDRNSGGNPKGGGNWVVETPCWIAPGGSGLARPMARYGPSGDNTLFNYGTGWSSQNDWLVYGGTWPFHNQMPISGYAGLKDGHEVTLNADTSAKSRPLKSLMSGCDAYGQTSFGGTILDSGKFPWDLD